MSPTERWQAVMARDRRFDGAFVYAVRSTGIYCRPSCGSRKPRRVARCKQELKRRKQVSPALYEAGYGSTSRVYERTHEQLGMTPATYARGGVGVEIVFVTVPTALGRLLVAATDRGVCRVMLGETATKLEADLRGEFDAADVREDHSGKLEGYV